MSQLFPLRGETRRTSSRPRVLELDGDGADETFGALSSETARRILAAVYEEPRTPTEIRDEVGTSLQNVHYHLENLGEADLIEPAGTGYSEKGNEMTIYAPANAALVLFAGDDATRTTLRDAVSRLLGGVGLLAVASLVVAVVTDSSWLPGGGTALPDGGKPTGAGGSKIVADAGSTLDPAVAFLFGGLFVVSVTAAWWYVRRRPTPA